MDVTHIRQTANGALKRGRWGHVYQNTVKTELQMEGVHESRIVCSGPCEPLIGTSNLLVLANRQGKSFFFFFCIFSRKVQFQSIITDRYMTVEGE